MNSNMNYYEKGEFHASVDGEVDKDWKAMCAASSNNRNIILRRLSVTQTGEAGSYRDGWIGTYIKDTGNTQVQAEGAYNRFVSRKIGDFAPCTAERSKRNAAELGALEILREKEFELEAKSVACQQNHGELHEKYRAQSSEFNELRDLAVTLSHKYRRVLDEATVAFKKADEIAKEALAFEGREFLLLEDPSSRTLEQWSSILDENRGDIQNVHKFMTVLRSKVGSLEPGSPNRAAVIPPSLGLPSDIAPPPNMGPPNMGRRMFDEDLPPIFEDEDSMAAFGKDLFDMDELLNTKELEGLGAAP